MLQRDTYSVKNSEQKYGADVVLLIVRAQLYRDTENPFYCNQPICLNICLKHLISRFLVIADTFDIL